MLNALFRFIVLLQTNCAKDTLTYITDTLYTVQKIKFRIVQYKHLVQRIQSVINC